MSDLSRNKEESDLSTQLMASQQILSQSTQSMRKKREDVSFDQRGLLVTLISENPELFTHSSTLDSEKSIWVDITDKLNQLKPEKNCKQWQTFLKSWINSLYTKEHNALTRVDCDLLNFLRSLGHIKDDDILVQYNNNLSKKEINSQLRSIERERERKIMQLDVDEDIYQSKKRELQELRKKITETKKSIKLLATKKEFFNRRRRLMKLKKKISARKGESKEGSADDSDLDIEES